MVAKDRQAIGLVDFVRSELLKKQGPLTRQLVRKPGEFGLGQVPQELAPDATLTATCGFCATGCGLKLHMRDGQAVNLSPDGRYPVNLGMACPKGWEALTPLESSDRATQPLLRKDGKMVPLSWGDAIGTFVSRMKAIGQRHGSQSVAFLSTGQIPSEEMAFLGALTKFGMGIVDGDGNTRQCMATAVVAYKQAFGFDAPPYSYADFEESDVLIFVGANPCIAHPIMWERVCRNKNHPTIVVVDPRRTETAMAATHHYAPTPKSDLSFFYGVARVLIERGWIDRAFIDAHTNDFDAFAAFVSAFDTERVSKECEVSKETIEELAELIHKGKKVSFWWTMGVNQSHQGVRTAQSLINLALMTGNIGRPGTGANSITGQCNAMGSRLFSNTTNLLGGHDFANPEDRRKVAGVLGIDEASIPDAASAPYDKILDKVLSGEIRGLWIIATNPAHSWINQGYVREILSRLEFLVVQDMYTTTETAQHADLLLPAAGWGEKEGTFINSERRVGVIHKVRRAPGQALADFHIFRLIADAWGCGEMFSKWTSPQAVFSILKELSAGQPCDITGIEDYAALAKEGGIQWPARAGQGPFETERRLFADAKFYHPDGKARFLCDEPRPLPEPTSRARPFTLLTGRGSSAQWHTQTRTSKSAVLNKLSPREIYVEICPQDARSIGISAGDSVTVASVRGALQARAFVTHNVKPGQVFIPMHFEACNRLTFPSFDPHSRQPAYKACAVSVCAAH